jgi:hypothetical protein
MKSGTEVDEATGPLDSRRQDIRGKGVNGENMSQSVFCNDAPGLPIADCGIVDNGVERTQPIHLLGHAASLRDAREITDHNGLRARNSGPRFLSPPLIPSMQNYVVPPLNHKLSRHFSQPIRRTGNEYSRHDSHLFCHTSFE